MLGQPRFSFLCNATHGSNGVDWIFPGSCFSAQHHCIGSAEDGAGNIRCFGACWQWRFHHALQHLRSNNARNSGTFAGGLNSALFNGNARKVKFNSKVAARNHHGVGFGGDGVKGMKGNGSFDFCNNSGDAATVRLCAARECASQTDDVCGGLHERQCYEICAVADGPVGQDAVACGWGCETDGSLGKIDALTA